MSKETGDVFLPFLCMPTNDGSWTIGVHSATNRLIFQYEVDGNYYKYYLTPNFIGFLLGEDCNRGIYFSLHN